ncbi:MAG: DUF1538 domain-containing protein [Gemmataceae bacterium]
MFNARLARKLFAALLLPLWDSLRDLLPILFTIAVFQLMVFRQPLQDVGQLLLGLLFVVLGLTLFISGLRIGLFPLGEQMAQDFARQGSLTWLIAFAFALGFGTTFAEPALIAVANQAAKLVTDPAAPCEGEAADGQEAQCETASGSFALVLRLTVAVAVGSALVLGVLRILLGWPLHYLIMSGYLLVMLLTPFSSQQILAVAYDSGGVTTSTITVPLTAALGVGLASSIRGRSPLLDGFGLIAFASLTPILFVLLLGFVWL